MALLYPARAHPYGGARKASIESVETSDARTACCALHADQRFAPSELTAVVVGDVDAQRDRDVAARVFGAWRKPSPPPASLPHPAPAVARAGGSSSR